MTRDALHVAPGRRLTHRDHVDTEVRREATTMALYVAILLLATLAATTADLFGPNLLALIWGSTLGVVLAHWFSFSVAARLLTHVHAHVTPAALLRAQLVAAAGIAVAASCAVVVLPEHAEHKGAVAFTAGSIGGVVYAQSRWAGASVRRSGAVASVALVAGFFVAALKFALFH